MPEVAIHTLPNQPQVGISRLMIFNENRASIQSAQMAAFYIDTPCLRLGMQSSVCAVTIRCSGFEMSLFDGAESRMAFSFAEI